MVGLQGFLHHAQNLSGVRNSLRRLTLRTWGVAGTAREHKAEGNVGT